MNPETLEFKLIDVGQGEYFLPGKEKITIVGSDLYKMPELILNITTYDYSIDIWPAGVVFAGMMFQKDIFFKPTKVYTDRVNPMEAFLRRSRDQLDAIVQTLWTLAY